MRLDEDIGEIPEVGEPGCKIEVPFPRVDLQFARAVQRSLLEADSLLQRYRLASADIDTAWRWMEELRAWREGLWEIVACFYTTGWVWPWDLDLDPSPMTFITTWRQLLLKVWQQVDPLRVAANFKSVETLH